MELPLFSEQPARRRASSRLVQRSGTGGSPIGCLRAARRANSTRSPTMGAKFCSCAACRGSSRAGQRLRRTASHSSMHTQSKTARAVARRANAGRPCSKKRSCEVLAFTTSSIFSQAATPNVQPMASSWRFARTAAAARVRNTAISRYRSCMRCAKQKMPAA